MEGSSRLAFCWLGQCAPLHAPPLPLPLSLTCALKYRIHFTNIPMRLPVFPRVARSAQVLGARCSAVHFLVPIFRHKSRSHIQPSFVLRSIKKPPASAAPRPPRAPLPAIPDQLHSFSVPCCPLDRSLPHSEPVGADRRPAPLPPHSPLALPGR